MTFRLNPVDGQWEWDTLRDALWYLSHLRWRRGETHERAGGERGMSSAQQDSTGDTAPQALLEGELQRRRRIDEELGEEWKSDPTLESGFGADIAVFADADVCQESSTSRNDAGSLTLRRRRLAFPEDLRRPDKYRFCLEPFASRQVSQRKPLFDEEATVEATAEVDFHFVWPIFRQRRQRLISLRLIRDAATTTLPMKGRIAQLKRILAESAVFRHVWMDDWTNSNGFSKPPDVPPQFIGEELRLNLILTDGVHEFWGEKRSNTFLRGIAGSGPTAIIHLLPRRLWSKTHIRYAKRQRAHVGFVDRPVSPRQVREWAASFFAGRYLPILEMHPDAICSWVSALIGHSRAEFLVFDLADERRDEGQERVANHERSMDPVSLVHSFDGTVSPAARDLARDLASLRANRFPLWLIGLVRERFQPESDLSIIAELCTSPIMIRIVKPDDSGPRAPITLEEDVVYRFAGPDSGKAVQDQLLVDQGKRRSEHISNFIREYFRHGAESERAIPLHLCAVEGSQKNVHEGAQPLFVLEGDPLFPWFSSRDVRDWKALSAGISALGYLWNGLPAQDIYLPSSESERRKVLSKLNALLGTEDLPERLTPDQRIAAQHKLPQLLTPALTERRVRMRQADAVGRYSILRLNRLILEGLFHDSLSASEPLVLFTEENANISALRHVAVDFERSARRVLVFDSYRSAEVHSHFNEVMVGASRREVEPDIVIAFPSFFFQIEATGFRRNETSVPFIDASTQEFVKQQLVMYRAPGEADECAIGVPFTVTTMILAYNRSMFDCAAVRGLFRQVSGKELEPPSEIFSRAAPSEAWDWLAGIASFFKAHVSKLRLSLPELQCGIALNGKRGAPMFYEWSALLCGHSAQISDRERGSEELDPDKGVVLVSPEVISATRFYLNLFHYAQHEKELRETGPEKQVELLARGCAPFGIVWSGFLPSLDARTDSFEYVSLPGNRSVVSGSTLVINRWTRRLDGALAFRHWVSTADTHRRLALNGFNTPITSILHGADFRRRWDFADAVRISLDRAGCSLEASRVAGDIIDAVCDALLASARELDSLPRHMEAAERRIRNARLRLG